VYLGRFGLFERRTIGKRNELDEAPATPLQSRRRERYLSKLAGLGFVSRVSPVQTALRN
jgi:hypothetical protein